MAEADVRGGGPWRLGALTKHGQAVISLTDVLTGPSIIGSEVIGSGPFPAFSDFPFLLIHP